MELLKWNDVTFRYPGEERAALSHIDLCFQQGGFYLVCGASGCGKSTLLRHMKKNLIPFGTRDGSVCFRGTPMDELDERTGAAAIGFVGQDPGAQIVTDKVWHELAFGLENLGLPRAVIRRRVAEMAGFFGMESWFHRDTAQLSGGQMQMLNLASILVAQPEVILLDEPTAQLDPVAAGDFLQMLQKINRDVGTTVILSEHHLEDVYAMADAVCVMEEGNILFFGSPKTAAMRVAGQIDGFSLPSAARIAFGIGVDEGEPPPLTVGGGRSWLSQRAQKKGGVPRPQKEENVPRPPREGNVSRSQGEGLAARRESGGKTDGKKDVIVVRGVSFAYDRNAPEVLRNLDLRVREGDLMAIVGGNGAGKSTLLKLLCHNGEAARGTMEILGQKVTVKAAPPMGWGKMVYLPQDPKALFTEITVEEELEEALYGQRLGKQEAAARVERMLEELFLKERRGQHPYDLSGGQQQSLALGKLLLLEPRILLMDEPTKGMDQRHKDELGRRLQCLADRGTAVVMASHDLEFCANYLRRVGMLFDGSFLAVEDTSVFFAGNRFYTTAANRIAADVFPGAVTVEEVIARWREAEMSN